MIFEFLRHRAFPVIWGFLIVLACSGTSYPSDPNATDFYGYRVSSIQVLGLTGMDEAYFFDLLDLNPGTRLSAGRLRKAVSRVFAKGLFQDISVETSGADVTNKTVSLLVRVREKQRIYRIYVHGNEYVSYSGLKRATGLYRGQQFKEDMIPGIRDKALKFLNNQGFPDSAVKVAVEPLDGRNLVKLTVEVAEGKPDMIRKVKVTGEGDLEYATFILALREGSIFKREEVLADLKKIREKLRNKGYYKAGVPDWSFTDGVLTVQIDSGPKYEFEFQGNEAFSSGRLRDEFRFEELEGDYGKEVLEDAARRYMLFYRNHGYPFAQVAAMFERPGDKVILSFYIYEGGEVTVREIKLEGVSLAPDKIDDILGFLGYRQGVPYSEDRIEKGISKMISLYNAIGYLKAEVLEVSKDFSTYPGGVIIRIVVSEGPKTIVHRVSPLGNTLFPDNEILKLIALEPGAPYNEVDVADARYRLLDMYGSAGYGDARIEIERSFSDDLTAVDLVFLIDEGNQLRYGKTIVSGNIRTKDELIYREFGLKEGQPYDYREVLKGKQRLHKMGIFSEVDVEVVEGQDETRDRDIIVNVKEGPFGSVDVGVGYGSYDKGRASIEIGHRNLMGLNRRISLKGELSSLLRRVSLNYEDPWLLLNYRLPLRATILAEKSRELDADTRDVRFESRKFSLIAGIERELTDELTAYLQYEYAFIDTFNVAPGEILSREELGILGLGSISPSLVRDTRDNPFNPGSGSVNALVVKWASGLLFSESTFVKPTIQSSWHFSLASPLVLACSLKSGLAWPLGDTEDLPIKERFFLGGGSSVRGFAQDKLGPQSADGTFIGGNAFVLLNFELRLDVWRDLGLVAFVDGGNVWRKISEFDPSELRYSWGGGVRYDTPVGPFRLDYGRKFDRKVGENAYEIHFNLGHAF